MAEMECGRGVMPDSFDVLIDSDVFVGLFLPDDAHFQRASALFDQFEQDKTKLAATNWVIAETATVLSRHDSQETAKKFLTMIETSTIPVLWMTKQLEKDAWQIFKDQTTKKTSFVDCSNVAVAYHFGISRLCAFDGFYSRFDMTQIK